MLCGVVRKWGDPFLSTGLSPNSQVILSDSVLKDQFLQFRVQSHNHSILVGGFNSSEKYESQLGWWNSQYMGKKTCSKPPTSIYSMYTHIQIREGTRNMFVPPWQDLVRSFQGITKAPNKLLQQELIVRIKISPDKKKCRRLYNGKSSGTVGIPTWIAVGSLAA